jgi:hypothetical protein
MGWGDVRYCFAMAILVIITSPEFLTIYFDFILAAILKWWPF